MKKSFGAAGLFERLKETLDREVGRGRRWTQEQFAEAVTRAGFPMKQNRVSDLMKAPMRGYNLVEIEAMCRVLAVPPEWMVFGIGSVGLDLPEDREPESVLIPEPKRDGGKKRKRA